MAHYAIVNENKIVTQVIVGKDEHEPLPEGYSSWEQYYGGLRTSYNTVGNVHANGGTPLRKNFAGIGYTYDSQRDAFYPPQPFASWVLDEDTCLWKAPVDRPTDGSYTWDEETVSWIAV